MKQYKIIQNIYDIASLLLGTNTTPNRNYLSGRNRVAKKYNISLAVLLNNQEKNIPWRFGKTVKETCHFLGSSAKPPSKYAISLAVGLNRQVNYTISLAVLLNNK